MIMPIFPAKIKPLPILAKNSWKIGIYTIHRGHQPATPAEDADSGGPRPGAARMEYPTLRTACRKPMTRRKKALFRLLFLPSGNPLMLVGEGHINSTSNRVQSNICGGAFYGNSERVKAVGYFCRRAPLRIFDTILNATQHNNLLSLKMVWGEAFHHWSYTRESWTPRTSLFSWFTPVARGTQLLRR